MVALAVDWSLYYGGWDMTGLLAACAAGASPVVGLLTVRMGAWLAFLVLRRLRDFVPGR
jgi:hypothetical protein